MSKLSEELINDLFSEINSEEVIDEHWDYAYKDGQLVPSSADEVKEARRKAADAKRNKSLENKQRKKQIIDEAINSTFVDLNATLTVEHKKLLIEVLTEPYTASMLKQETYINSTIEKCLRMVMPRDLLNAWAKYRNSMIPSPCFTYTASKEYGENKSFKVNLDLPYYFSQDTCMNILLEHFSNRLHVIDKAVVFFYKYKDTRTKQEIKIAQQLTKIRTFFELVQKNAFWYEKLINKLKDSQE